ncbi:MAG: AraC family ligand binding domain-containing protein [Rhodomicrobium sp.]
MRVISSAQTHKVTQHRSKVRGIDAIEFESGRAFPRHCHDQYGIGVLLSGAQRSWSGIGPVESFAGSVITVNPGEMHDGVPAGGCVRRWRMLYFDPPVLSGIVEQAEFESPSLRDPGLAKLVLSLFRHAAGDGDPLAVEELLVRLAVPLLGIRDPSAKLRGFSPAVAKAKARIDADPASPATLSELAALSGMSRFHLVRAFARELGATPHAYLVQRRVRLARQLLLSGEPPAIAAQGSGFADQSHMTRAFVRHFGITPARYVAVRAGQSKSNAWYTVRNDAREGT